jgi:hypothetical protein
VAVKKTKELAPIHRYDDLSIIGSTVEEQCRNMISKILSAGALRKPELLDYFAHQQRQQIPNNKLSEISINDLDSFIDELCLPLHDLFVLKTMGNAVVDQYRYTVISLFEKKNNWKKSELMQAWESDAGTTPSAGMYTKIMQEVATYKGGTWHMK